MSTLIEACDSFDGAGAFPEDFPTFSGPCSRRRRLLSRTRSNPMCDYSLHAVATRPAKVGETLITTTFRGTSTRGFASESDTAVAVCMLPGTELAFAEDVKYDNRWIWTKAI